MSTWHVDIRLWDDISFIKTNDPITVPVIPIQVAWEPYIAPVGGHLGPYRLITCQDGTKDMKIYTIRTLSDAASLPNKYCRSYMAYNIYSAGSQQIYNIPTAYLGAVDNTLLNRFMSHILNNYNYHTSILQFEYFSCFIIYKDNFGINVWRYRMI